MPKKSHKKLLRKGKRSDKKSQKNQRSRARSKSRKAKLLFVVKSKRPLRKRTKKLTQKKIRMTGGKKSKREYRKSGGSPPS